MEDVFENDRDRLAALQSIDSRLKEKRDRIALLEGAAQELAGRIGVQRAEMERLSADRDALEAKRRELEARLETEEAKIKGSRMRMNRVRNERELLALKHEVTVSKEANQQLEEQLIEMMERLEQYGKQIGAAEEQVRSLEAQAASEDGGRRDEVERLNAEIASEIGRRESLAGTLEKGLRARYEQIFERRGGTAVVEVRQGTCQGCRVSVPPQLFNELQKTRDVRQCPNCHRILYWRPEAAA